MKHRKILDIMSPRPEMIKSTQTLHEAAKLMKDMNCGALPVGTPEKVIGIITDRDIVVRALADGADPTRTTVGEIMTKQVYGCEEDDTPEEAAERMRKHDISRLVVRKGGEVVTGVVSLADLLVNAGGLKASDSVLHKLLAA